MADKRRVAWGITGSGDKLAETLEVMKRIINEYSGVVEVELYLSKAGYQVTRYYRLFDDLEESFGRPQVEIDSNTPFLAGALQLGRFEFLLIAPASANTVAKISTGIADTLLCNAAIMALKAFSLVYILPSDLEEGVISTKLPDGHDLKLRIRREDAENARKLVGMDGVFVLKKPEDIDLVFQKHFKSNQQLRLLHKKEKG